MIEKALHRKQKFEQHDPSKNMEVNSCAQQRKTAPVPLVVRRVTIT